MHRFFKSSWIYKIVKGKKNCYPRIDPTSFEYTPLLQKIRQELTPNQDPPSLEVGYFTTSDSTRLFTRRWSSPTEKVKGVILCFHGMGGDGEYFVLLADQLCSIGYDVIVYDHYGHGFSAGVRGDIDHFSRHSLYAYEMICSVAARYRGKSLFLLAESMGGTILINALTQNSSLPSINGVLLFAPGVKFQTGTISFKDFLRGILAIIISIVKPGALTVLLRSPNMSNIKNGNPIMNPLHFEYDRTHPWHWDYASIRFLNQLRQAFNSALNEGPNGMKYPVILFYGLNDIGIARDGVNLFFNRIPHENKQLYEIPDAPHAMFTHHTFQPYWEKIREWLKNNS
jgi:alpha-beta hydrolase superfamily lysophospholipase